MRVAFVSNHPAPYRDPFLGRIVKRSDIEVDVYSLFSEDTGHRFWGLESPPYRNKVLVPEPCPPKWRTLLKLLRMFVFGKYDCVCWPGFHWSYLIECMILQVLLGKKYVISADTVSQRPTGWISFHIKRLLVRHAHMIFVPGIASRDYFVRTFAVSAEKVCKGTYALDSKSICDKVTALRKSRDAIRTRYGISASDKVFLMVANMIKTRHYPITASAFLNVSKKFPDVKFVMVGVGPDLEQIQNLASENAVLKVVPGVSFDGMLELYAMADVYVHGGKEPASTALVIGAITALPLLSSRAVGCSWDCLEDGKSGCLVSDYLSEGEWIHGFERMLENKHLWTDWGQRARELSQALDVELTVENFCSTIKR